MGLIRLVDYEAVVGLARELKGLMNIGLTMQKSQVMSDQTLTQQDRQQQLRAIDKEIKEQNKSLGEMGIDGIASTIEALYGNVVRVKIVPNVEIPDQVFVGTCEPEALDLSFRRAIGSRGYSTIWPLEGLVYAEPATPDTAPEMIPTGNDMEDAIDAIVGQMDALARIAGGYEFPAISCIPLAIYRVISDERVRP